MNKRGQISVFIVVAIVIVAGLLIYFSLREGPTVSVNPEIAPVFNLVQGCLEKSSLDAVYHIGQYGGYYVVPERASKIGMPFYYDRGRSYILSKEQLEFELAKFVENDLFFCTKNFVELPGYLVTSSEIKVNVDVAENEVKFRIDYPLSIKKGEDVFTINSFESRVDSRLDIIYSMALKIAEMLIRDRGTICINCISDLALENEVIVGIDQDLYNEDVLIFSLVDQSDINEEEYRYYFAIRYHEN